MKDISGLVYQLIKKVNLLTKRIEELETWKSTQSTQNESLIIKSSGNKSI